MTKNIPENYYFHGEIAKNFDFYQMPTFIITHPIYSKISDSAKILYMLLFNRMRLSVANGWSDDKGRTYIIYGNENIVKDMNVGKTKATNIFMELVNAGLIEKVRVQNRPSRIYVFNFMQIVTENSEETEETKVETLSCSAKNENTETITVNTSESPVNKPVLSSTANTVDGQPQIEVTDDRKHSSPSTAITVDNNKSDINKNNNSQIYSNHINPSYEGQADGCVCENTPTEDDYENYKELIEDNIDYYGLCSKYTGTQRECLDEIVELMAETVTFANTPIKINKTLYPASVVKSRFLKLGCADIESVIDWFFSPEATTGALERIKNIRAYMIAMLFNCKTTRNTGFQNFFNATYYGDYSPRACI